MQNDMKANELMIGDWVKWKDDGEFYQISEIDEVVEGEAHVCFMGYNYMVHLDEIEPIWITPGVLEKNGWECVGEEEGPCQIMQVYDSPDAFWWTKRNGECGCERSVDKNGEEWIERTFFCLQVGYVHELQHALRLADIGKKIIL